MMFRETPKNYDGISHLIELVRSIGGKGAKEISRLLEAVNDFLTATNPEGQIRRDLKITDERKLQILTDIANALNTFSGLNNDSNRFRQSLDLAKATVEVRLAEMRNKKDKIYLYYESHANPLKLICSPSTKTTVPLPRN